MRNQFTMAIIILAIFLSACGARQTGLHQKVVSVNNICELSMHPALYAGKQVQLTTKLINALPHGLSLYSGKCSVPILNIAYSDKFDRDGSQKFENTLIAYLADQGIRNFRIIVLGHLGWGKGGQTDGKPPRFYFDKIISLKPDEPPIQPGLKIKDVNGDIIEPL